MSKRINSQLRLFTNRLLEIFQQKNFNQMQLAVKIECSQSANSEMLNGNSRPRRTAIIYMAAALDVSPTDLCQIWKLQQSWIRLETFRGNVS